MYQSRVLTLCQQMRLTPFQSYILEQNAYKYNLGRLVKRGDILYVPYVTSGNRWTDAAARLLLGARADLIGPDKILVQGQRGIEFFADGRYIVRRGNTRHYIDIDGRAMGREDFWRAVNNRRR